VTIVYRLKLIMIVDRRNRLLVLNDDEAADKCQIALIYSNVHQCMNPRQRILSFVSNICLSRYLKSD
jgi:hypothetical protein